MELDSEVSSTSMNELNCKLLSAFAKSQNDGASRTERTTRDCAGGSRAGRSESTGAAAGKKGVQA